MTRHGNRPLPLGLRAAMWLHRRRCEGTYRIVSGLTVGLDDPSARGVLVTCRACDKAWAR